MPLRNCTRSENRHFSFEFYQHGIQSEKKFGIQDSPTQASNFILVVSKQKKVF